MLEELQVIACVLGPPAAGLGAVALGGVDGEVERRHIHCTESPAQTQENRLRVYVHIHTENITENVTVKKKKKKKKIIIIVIIIIIILLKLLP